MIDNKRTGNSQRLESFRADEEQLAGIFSSGHNFRGPGTLLTRRLEVNHDNGEEEESEEEPKINTEQTFKSDDCVICLNNPPNVLFCNCGHIAICVEYDKVKRLKDCPMCKTETTIKRTLYIEY